MSGDRDRTNETNTNEGRMPIPSHNEDLSLMSGEALDDDELDELCDATLATIGDLSGK